MCVPKSQFYPIGGMIHHSAICFVAVKEPVMIQDPSNVKEQLKATEDYLSDLDNFSESYQEEQDIDRILAEHGYQEEEHYN